jgi:hypothetical protein
MSVGIVTLGVMKADLSLALLGAQHGIFSRRQALRAGITRGAINARVRRGTWRRVFPGVYTTITGELRRINLLWAVLLYAGRGAALSHETAAALHGLGGRPANEIHVTIPAARRVAALPGVRIHRSSRVFQTVLAHHDPPCTSVEETVLDLIDATDTLDDVCGWITRALTRELTSEIKLCTAIAGRSRLRWRTELDAMIAATVAGDHSVLEHRYTRDVERAHGLPEPERQVPFTTPDGQRGRRDRVYKRYDVVVELDGQLYHEAEDAWDDKERDNAALVAGNETLRYGWKHVQRPCATAIQVAKVLRAKGWDGHPRPCSIYCPVRLESR